MCNCNSLEHVCKCCTLLRGPKTLTFQKRTTGCHLNFEFEHVPQFQPVEIEGGERTVEIYQCHDVPGYKDAYIVVVSKK